MDTFDCAEDDPGKKRDLSYFSHNEIHPAPENNLVYDGFSPSHDEDDYALYKSIKEEGIREPLHVSVDGVILSGHRRHAAARLLQLDRIPCIVNDVVYRNLSKDERLAELAVYNKQRDKSYVERLREAMLSIDPDQAHQRLIADRQKRFREVDNNIVMGPRKNRARITTLAFLRAAQTALESERDYWPLTVRRVHYLLLNDPPLRHDKKPGSIYRNDKASYKALTNLLLRARLAGEIPLDAIDDETRPIMAFVGYQSSADFIKNETEQYLRHYRRDLLRGQQNHIEIVVEKNAIRKHVEKVAAEYCIPCTTSRGYSSLTPRYKIFQRFTRSGKGSLVLLFLSDFDPDGEQIAASFSQSLRDDFYLEGVTACKVALSGEDVLKYGLPCDLEAKESSPNYKKFVRRHGIHVAELDAAPVELLQQKLREAIEGALDMEIFEAEIQREKKDAAYIQAVKNEVVEHLKAANL